MICIKLYAAVLLSLSMLHSCNAQPSDNHAPDSSVVYISGSVSDFDSLILRFKGTPVFVDIWATWCLPCRREFRHVKYLQELAAGNRIVLLYVSGDKDEDEEEWKKVVAANRLQGCHIRMNKLLKADIQRRFSRPLKSNGQPALIYPTYLIIDKTGAVVNANAPKPGDKALLLNELRVHTGL